MSDPVILQPASGGQIVREAGEAEAVQRQFGNPEVSPEPGRAAERDAQRRALFNTLEDQVLTIAEGVTDALSLGALRETGEAADIRRGENPGSQFTGNLLGTVLGLKMPGPLKWTAEAGEAAGRAAAKRIVKNADGVIGTGLREAGSGAAMTGAWATGHQVMDSVIEDKEFSAEAVLDQVKVDGLLSMGAGMLIGALGKAGVSHGAVKAQGGLQGKDLNQFREVHLEAMRAYDDVVAEHAARLGAIKGMRAEGVLNSFADDILPVREEALRNAQSARRAMDKFNTKGIWDADPKEYARFQAARDKYFSAVDDLDAAFKPRGTERAPVVELGAPSSDTYLSPPPGEIPVEIPGAKTGAHSPRAAAEPAEPVVSPDAPTVAGETPAYRKAPNEAPPEAIQELLPENTRVEFGIDNAGRQMLPEHLAQITKGAKVVHPHPVSEAADNMLQGEVQEWPLLKLRNGWFMPQDTINANALWFQKAFPDVVDPVALKQWQERLAPHQANTAVGGPALGYQQPKGDLAALNAAVEKIPLRDPPAASSKAPVADPDATVLEDVPAAKLNAAADKAAAKEAREMERAMRKADRGAGPTVFDDAPDVKRARAQDQLNEWVGSYNVTRPSPADRAASRIQELMDELQRVSGGRLDSAAGIRFSEREGVVPSPHLYGGRMDQVWALRRVGKLAANEARGVKTGLRDGIKEDIAALGLGAAFGDPLVALAAKYLGFGGRVAAHAGKLMQVATGAARKFLTPTRSRAVLASAVNTAWSYSERGPIKDPVERIEEIRRLASDPQGLGAKVAENAGDLAMVHPEFVESLKARATLHLNALAQAAPQITYDALGRPLNPPAGEMRKFLEFENAMHDLGGILRSVESGAASPGQVRALKIGFPAVHAKMVAEMLGDPDRLRNAPRERLRAVESLTDIPLTPTSDPGFIQRQAEAWTPAEQPQQPQRPQAFSINPVGAPTPSQSGARAPGN